MVTQGCRLKALRFHLLLSSFLPPTTPPSLGTATLQNCTKEVTPQNQRQKGKLHKKPLVKKSCALFCLCVAQWLPKRCPAMFLALSDSHWQRLITAQWSTAVACALTWRGWPIAVDSAMLRRSGLCLPFTAVPACVLRNTLRLSSLFPSSAFSVFFFPPSKLVLDRLVIAAESLSTKELIKRSKH